MRSLRYPFALLALFLVSLPLQATDPTLSDIKKGLDDLREEVRKSNLSTIQEVVELRKRLQALEKSVETLQRLPDRVALYPPQTTDPTLSEIKKGLDDLREEVRKSNLATFQEVVDLRKRLQGLEKSVETLQRLPDRISLYPPQTMGAIRLENRLAVPATIMVNDVAYRLQPFQVRDLPAQSAGTFTFEVLVEGYGSLQPRATRTLEANRVYTIYTYIP